MRNYLLTFILLVAVVYANATHIMGGDISYKYLGYSYTLNGVDYYSYDLTFTVYSNCDSESNFPDGPPPDIQYAVYQEGFNPSADKPYIQEQRVFVSSQQQFTPQLPAGCNASIDVCIFEGKYTTTVDLPLTFNGNFSNGYHIYFDVCCRNGNIVNIQNPGAAGSGFYAYIPSPLVNNSSPVFSDSPVPFLCVGETTPLLNTAFDPDGDLLVFSFADPYDGYSTTSNPQPGYSDLDGGGNPIHPDLYPNLNWPIENVTWETGYNMNQPFGASGSATINGFTGYSEYTPSATGNYVVAVEIKEYNSSTGALRGITRRDMQMIVINCPSNTPPNLSNAGTSGQTSYTIEEGANLCFDVTFEDANNDFMELTSNGDIFDASLVSPPATIGTPVSGTGSVTAPFCWDTECGQGRDQPYLFTVNATDDGCLPKTTPDVYSILVTDFVGPTKINGSTNVCAGQQGEIYNVSNSAGATYNWSVSGGTIASGQGTNSISINWGNSANGNINVTPTSQHGCVKDPLNLLVNINNIPIDAGNDASICFGESVTLGGSPTAPAGFQYLWSPSTGLSSATSANPIASPSTTVTYNLTVTDGDGCFAYDDVTVNVSGVLTNVSNDTTICSGDTIQLNASGGSGYTWTPNTNIDNINSANPLVYPTSTTSYIVSVSSASGCENSDTVIVTVAPAFTADAGLDFSLCDGESQTIGGSPTGPAGYTFGWSPSTYLDNPNIANPTTTPTADVEYIVTVTDGFGCTGIDSIEVTLFPTPTANAGNDMAICIEDTVQITATGGVTYNWSPTTSMDNANSANPNIFPSSTTTYSLTVTNSDGCSDTDDIVVTVNNLPTAEAGEDDWICPGDSAQLQASGGSSYIWSPSTGLSSTTDDNPKADPGDTTIYYVTVTDINNCSAIDSVTIFSTAFVPTDAGNDTIVCIGDSAQLGGNPTAPSGTTYIWTPSTGLSDVNSSNPKASPSVPTWYYVSTSNDTCNGYDSVFVDLFALPLVNAGIDQQICINDSVQLNATGATDYQWNNGNFLSDSLIANPFAKPSDTLAFIVTGTDVNTCSNSDTVNIVVNPLPVVTVTANPVQICIGDTAELMVLGTVDSYNWLTTDSLSAPNSSITDAWPTDTTYYVIEITDSNTCVNLDSVLLIVNPLPIVSAGLDQEICIYDTTQLVATGGDIYLWSPTDSLMDINNVTTDAWPTTTTEYTVMVTDSNGCVNYDTTLITVHALPLVDAGLDDVICLNDTTLLTASGAADYIWTPDTYLETPNNASTNAWPITTTEFFVEGTDNNGCVNIDSMMVTVNALPVTSVTANPIQICIGDTSELTASGGISYVWLTTDSLSSLNTSITDAWPTDTTTYYVEVTDANGCKQQDSTIVVVNPLPSAYAGEDVWLCPTDTTMLIASGGIIYNWLVTDSLSDPSNDTTMAWPMDTTNYIVEVTDTNNCINYDTVMVIVNTIVPTDAGPDQLICQFDQVIIGGNPTSPAGTTYSWNTSTGLSDTTIANPTASVSDTTKFWVNTLNHVCNGSDTVMVFTHDLPIADAGLDVQICINDSVTLNATGGIDYNWTPNNNILNSGTASPTVWPTDTMNYYVEVTDINGCVNIDSLQIIVNPLPIISITGQNVICNGDTTEIIATGGEQYSWSPNNNLINATNDSALVYPFSNEVYTVLVTDSNTCRNSQSYTITVNALPIVDAGIDTSICINDSTLLIATGAVTYQWSPNYNLTTLINDSTTAFPQTDTMYYVHGTDGNGCVNLDSVFVTVHDLPLVDAGSDEQICIGDSVELNATGGITYNWSPNAGLSTTNSATTTASPLDTTKYLVTVIDINGCTNVDSIWVVVNPLPSIDAGNDTISCIGSPIVLGGTPTAPSGSAYNWSPTTYLDNSTISNPTSTPNNDISYYLQVTDTNGCISRDTISISLFDIQASSDTSICNGDNITLSVTTISGYSPYTYAWSPADQLSSSSSSTVIASATANTEYAVSVTDANGCTEFRIISLVVNDTPDAAFDFTLDPTCKGMEATFTNNSTNADSYTWTFNSNVNSNEFEPTYVFNYSSNPTILLEATNQYGCYDSISYNSENISDFESYIDLEMPTIFTPNGDGTNDLFEAQQRFNIASCTKVSVYNRWGNLIFETEIGEAWDGTNKRSGKEVPEGVYFYVVDINGILFKGSISVRR